MTDDEDVVSWADAQEEDVVDVFYNSSGGTDEAPDVALAFADLFDDNPPSKKKIVSSNKPQALRGSKIIPGTSESDGGD